MNLLVRSAITRYSLARGSAERQLDALLAQLRSHSLEPGIAVVEGDDCAIGHAQIEARDLLVGYVGAAALDAADLRQVHRGIGGLESSVLTWVCRMRLRHGKTPVSRGDT